MTQQATNRGAHRDDAPSRSGVHAPNCPPTHIRVSIERALAALLRSGGFDVHVGILRPCLVVAGPDNAWDIVAGRDVAWGRGGFSLGALGLPRDSLPVLRNCG